MKIKFNFDDELPLNKVIQIRTMITAISRTMIIAFFHENNKYYPQVLLDECLYKLQII